MIVADASWVIALNNTNHEFHERAAATETETSAVKTLLHPVTLAECLVSATRAGQGDRAARELRAAYTIPDVDGGAILGC